LFELCSNSTSLETDVQNVIAEAL